MVWKRRTQGIGDGYGGFARLRRSEFLFGCYCMMRFKVVIEDLRAPSWHPLPVSGAHMVWRTSFIASGVVPSRGKYGRSSVPLLGHAFNG